MRRTDPTDPRERLARYLRQRAEMGESEVLLDGMTRDEALRSLEPPPIRAAVFEPPEIPEIDLPLAPVAAAPSDSVTPEVPMATAGSSDSEIALLPYEELRESALACTRCRLAEGRLQAVFSDGNPDARLMVVGEAPGQREDETGLPFVGPAGRYLDLLLASVGLSRRDSVYICNVIKCRPPGNRNPLPDEIEACAPYLRRQIELVRPEAILAVGTFASQLLTGRDSPLGRLRGEVYSYQGVPLVVTYHPAALLRNPGWTRPTWDDLQLLRQIIDETDD